MNETKINKLLNNINSELDVENDYFFKGVKISSSWTPWLIWNNDGYATGLEIDDVETYFNIMQDATDVTPKMIANILSCNFVDYLIECEVEFTTNNDQLKEIKEYVNNNMKSFLILNEFIKRHLEVDINHLLIDVNTIADIDDIMEENSVVRCEELNGSGIMNLEGIKHSLYHDENIDKVKEIIKEFPNDFVILYAYGAYESRYIFSKYPPKIDKLETHCNFEGHGTCIVLEDVPKNIFIYGEDD